MKEMGKRKEGSQSKESRRRKIIKRSNGKDWVGEGGYVRGNNGGSTVG